jgi:hypothetical protein
MPDIVAGLLGLFLLGLWIYCLYDVIVTDEVIIRHLPEVLWLIIVFVLPTSGACCGWRSAGPSTGPAGWPAGGNSSTRRAGPWDRPVPRTSTIRNSPTCPLTSGRGRNRPGYRSGRTSSSGAKRRPAAGIGYLARTGFHRLNAPSRDRVWNRVARAATSGSGGRSGTRRRAG